MSENISNFKTLRKRLICGRVWNYDEFEKVEKANYFLQSGNQKFLKILHLILTLLNFRF